MSRKRKPPGRPADAAAAGPRQAPSGRRRDSRKPGQLAENKWIYGLHAVRAGLANRARTHRRLVAQSADLVAAERLPPGLGAEILSRDEIAALLPEGAVHQGLALLSELPPAPDLAALCAAPAGGDVPDDTRADTSIVVVLDQVTDPRNLGAILRSAAVFGAAALVVQERHAPPLTGVVAKAASGGIERVPLVRATNLARALAQLGDAGFWRLGLDAAAAVELAAARPAAGWRRTALVVGAEGRGLRPLVARSCDELVRIGRRAADLGPAPGSLNVAAAAAIGLYELRRR